ncbi:hypothetical protein LTR62_006270 [Meristemomyces frigidus]|uniref:EamA domain-containing protein n=1 Tax=Meristemomyces frigidus TaxID=1508187 RepID=A0AAN7YQ19_9PEZI|nr:hypothetical protein LTR62_006270 [Meristemomyces frigidus]
MSLPPRLLEDGSPSEDKARLLYHDQDTENIEITGSRPPSPKLENQIKADAYASGNGFLTAPLTGPIRPLSPDTLSILSADEYEQIHPTVNSPYADNATDHLGHAGGETANWRIKLHAFYLRNKGLGYMLIAQIFGTLMNVTTRLLEIEGNNGKGMHPFQILFARMGITVVLATAYMWYKKTPDFPFGKREVRWLLVARGFGGLFGVTGMYWSLLYLPLADATVITFLAPALACWACSILIKEPFGRVEQVSAFVSLIGVVLIAKPTTMLNVFGNAGETPPAIGDGDVLPSGNGTMAGRGDASNYDNVTPSERLFAVALALMGVLGAATAYTTIRWIGKRAHPLISVNYFAAWCTLVSTVMMLALPWVGFLLPANLKEWGYLFFLGTCGFIMQFLLAAGLAYEKSSRATNITYTQMLFALGFDKVIFGHTPDLMSIAGSSLILGSAIVVATMASTGKNGGKQESEAQSDVEAQQGLMSGIQVEREGRGDNEAYDLNEIPLRALR